MTDDAAAQVEFVGGPVDGTTEVVPCTAADGGPPYLLSFYSPASETVVNREVDEEHDLEFELIEIEVIEVRYQRQDAARDDGIWRYQLIKE